MTELAAELGLTGMGIRRHLEVLEVDGLVERTSCPHHGIGRPPHGWRLSATGMELLPRSYDTFVLHLLEDLCEHVGEEGVDVVLRRRGEKVAVQYGDELAGAGASTLDERVAGLAQIRDQAGYVAEWRRDGRGADARREQLRRPPGGGTFPGRVRHGAGPLPQGAGSGRGGHPGVAHHGRRRHLHLPHPAPPRRPPVLIDPVAAAVAVADVLAPAAEATDQAPVVPQANLRLLADAGLSDLLEAPPAVVREVHETLAGACGVTYFVWEQHHAPVRLLAAARGADDPTVAGLRSGAHQAGIAFAYLRRPGPPAVVARPRSGGGVIVDGEAPWVTSWGLADTFVVAARMRDDVVNFLLDGSSPPPGVQASAPLALAAMNASSTVRLQFDGLVVPEQDLISVEPYERWRAADRRGHRPAPSRPLRPRPDLLSPTGRRRPGPGRRAGRLPRAGLRPHRRGPDRRGAPGRP